MATGWPLSAGEGELDDAVAVGAEWFQEFVDLRVVCGALPGDDPGDEGGDAAVARDDGVGVAPGDGGHGAGGPWSDSGDGAEEVRCEGDGLLVEVVQIDVGSGDGTEGVGASAFDADLVEFVGGNGGDPLRVWWHEEVVAAGRWCAVSLDEAAPLLCGVEALDALLDDEPAQVVPYGCRSGDS